MKRLLFLLGLFGSLVAPLIHPSSVAAQRGFRDLRVQLWADDRSDFFRAGDRVRLQFRTSEDAYIAVVHIDTDGNLNFLYPFSPREDEYVRGDRAYSVYPRNQRLDYWTVRDRPGIGYFYVIASEEPLDLRAFRDRYGSGWDFTRIGRGGVRGDPFWALDQLTEILVPYDFPGSYATDVWSYHVGGRHRYPRYACYDGYASASGYATSGYGWGGYYDRCDRILVLLGDRPGYYDTYRYGGDRRVYLGESSRAEPRHGYKESPRGDRSRGALRDRNGDAPPPRAQPRAVARGEPEAPARQRPTLERRPPERESSPPAARPAPPRRDAEPAPPAARPERDDDRRVRPAEPSVPSARRPGR